MRRPNVSVRPVSNVGRRSRRPQHRFQVASKPWQIQPFMIAPVLPGETLQNLLLQARIISDPIKHPLIGWWAEMYYFYVKHRDLAQRELFTQMMLNDQTDMSSVVTAAKVKHNHPGGIDWVGLCTHRIVEEYFRNEGEQPEDFMIDGMFASQIMDKSWLDSVIPDSAFDIPDEDVDLNADGNIMASEIQEAMRNYQFMQQHGLTDMSYEDFLRTYGVRTARTELHRPELIRYVRDWTYPVNTVEPTTGIPTTAASWSLTERADKTRFFAEPGFIVGLAVVRPKVYLGNLAGSAVSLMDDALAWLPAIMRDDPYSSLRKAAMGTGPLKNTTEDYWVDIKDLFLYGDQFTNFAVAGSPGSVALPSPALQKMYASLADADGLFSGEARTIRMDGITTLNVLGTIIDQTQTQNTVPGG